jgi:ribosome modulation factor
MLLNAEGRFDFASFEVFAENHEATALPLRKIGHILFFFFSKLVVLASTPASLGGRTALQSPDSGSVSRFTAAFRLRLLGCRRQGGSVRKTATQAYDMGYLAGSSGTSMGANPFRRGQVHVSWMVGWINGNNDRHRKETK